jgi:hypothetical protein
LKKAELLKFLSDNGGVADQGDMAKIKSDTDVSAAI